MMWVLVPDGVAFPYERDCGRGEVGDVIPAVTLRNMPLLQP